MGVHDSCPDSSDWLVPPPDIRLPRLRFDIFPELVTAIPVLALQLVIAAFSLFLVYRWVRRSGTRDE